MIGPILGTLLAKDYDRAVLIAAVFTSVSGVLVTRLPDVSLAARTPAVVAVVTTERRKGFGALSSRLKVSSEVLGSGPIFLMCLRVLMSLAFHIFHTIWAPSLKRRFDFGPRDHGQFMSFLGLNYALSQGVIAKKIIKVFPEKRHRCKILMISAVLLGGGRYFAFQTNSLNTVYALFGVLIVTLGVVNTIVSADASGLVASNEMGSLFGTLEAVESAAGIVGPVIGGTLSLYGPVDAPLMAVVALYGVVFIMVYFGYERFVLNRVTHVDGVKKL